MPFVKWNLVGFEEDVCVLTDELRNKIEKEIKRLSKARKVT